MRKIRSSTKIAIGFVLLVTLIWFGYNKLTDYLTMREKFAPLVPSRIDIVGLNPGAGYKVIVANDVAQLVETQGAFSSGDSDSDAGDEGAVKKRISVKDMLGILRGDGDSLVTFVRSLNDLKEDDLPPIRVIWTEDRLEKAIAGDPKLKAALESDLNVKLDGTPLSHLNLASLENGIVVQFPITVSVVRSGGSANVTGQMQIPFKPRLVKAVEADYADKANPDATMRAGYYKQEAEKVLASPTTKEDIGKALAAIYSQEAKNNLVSLAKGFLKSATVVVNDHFIENARYERYGNNDTKPLYHLIIDLNDEGRRRLAQFSRTRVGDQILLTSDGVAIAAARIEHPLLGGEVTISHMADQTLLDDFIDTLKQSKSRVARN